MNLIYIVQNSNAKKNTNSAMLLDFKKLTPNQDNDQNSKNLLR